MVARIGTDAVVLGAGIAGLLAARVLTESFDRVTLVERDDLPGIGEHRRGVPQDRHLLPARPRAARPASGPQGGKACLVTQQPSRASVLHTVGARASEPLSAHRPYWTK